MAENQYDLLSLPDQPHKRVALQTRSWSAEPPREVGAALTCKPLSKLQLPSDPVLRIWPCLRWHLKHCQDAESIRFHIEDWPEDDEQMEDLSKTLVDESFNLQQLKHLVFWPSRRSLRPLSPWILHMLSGASGLKHATLAVELLSCLPDYPTLESLHIDARDGRAIWDIFQALKQARCHRLVSLTITCHEESRAAVVPELNLRHLVRLSNCHLRFLPAPRLFFPPQGGPMLELTVAPKQVLAWSKSWQTIRDRVQCITVEGYPEYSHHARPAGLLLEWPPGIAVFRGLQFLQLSCEGMGGEYAGGALDLAQLSYIPHVTLCSTGHLNAKIPKRSCNWKILRIKSEGVFSVLVEDAESFLRDIGKFYFSYPVMEYPEWARGLKTPWDLSQELKRAGEEVKKPVHEYSATSPLGDESSVPLTRVLSNC